MPQIALEVDNEKLRDFCRRWKLTEFSLFGSVVRDNFGPESDVATAMRKGGIPYTPGAVLGPSSKTSRSKPGLWAIRMATSWAWFAFEPPVWSGQAVAGVLPGLAPAVGLEVKVGGVVGAALPVRVAVVALSVLVVGMKQLDHEYLFLRVDLPAGWRDFNFEQQPRVCRA